MNSRNLLWVPVLRLIAVFFVISIHAGLPLLYSYGQIPDDHWWTANIYDSMTRVCVPIFFMISGYLLLGKHEPITVFLRKRFNRVLLPLAAWTSFYLLWRKYYEGETSLSWADAIKSILSPAYYHLWFLYAIIGIYLYMPILRILAPQLNGMSLYYFLGLWYLAASLIPFAENAANITSNIDLRMISGFVGYFVIGYFLGGKTLSKKQTIYLSLILIFLLCFTALVTYYFTFREGRYIDYFHRYLSPSYIPLSVIAFVLLKELVERTSFGRGTRATSVLQAMDSAVFGIYLIHPIFLVMLEKGTFGFSLSAFQGHPLYSIPGVSILVFGLSFISIYVLQKIPLINKLIPQNKLPA
ncbi:MAG TPA: acyltransferase family protein [Anaerolineales bacterium]|nr:acyltransferase family protein [Anaerolineales bacterium]